MDTLQIHPPGVVQVGVRGRLPAGPPPRLPRLRPPLPPPVGGHLQPRASRGRRPRAGGRGERDQDRGPRPNRRYEREIKKSYYVRFAIEKIVALNENAFFSLFRNCKGRTESLFSPQTVPVTSGRATTPPSAPGPPPPTRLPSPSCTS